MFGMFDWNDLAVLGGIIGVDLVMSGDNAVIIALASQRLSEKMKKRVMLFGCLAAVALRILLTSVAVTLLELPYLKIMGGLVLVWIAYKLMASSHDDVNCKEASCVMEAVKTILIADAVMSMDNVLALAAVARNSQHEYLFLMFGLLLSLPIVMFGASMVSRLLERYPVLVYVGSGILLYAAGELIVSEPFLAGSWIDAYHLAFIGGLTFGMLGLGYWKNTRSAAGEEELALVAETADE